MEFVEAPAFTRYLSSYLNDSDYEELQTRLGAKSGAWGFDASNGRVSKAALG